jgi:hypothetical protein
MGRIINPEGVGKERTQLTRGIVLALRELMQQTETTAETRDLAAFIALALEAIQDSIDPTVEAWEKRGYWVKADRFRMEWAWAGRLAAALRTALLADDWPAVAQVAVQVGQKLNNVTLPQRHRLGQPWAGAWQTLKKSAARKP